MPIGYNWGLQCQWALAYTGYISREDQEAKMTSTATPETRAANVTFDRMADERYVIVDNGDGTYSLRDTSEHRWIELRGQEDMTRMEAHDLREEYRHG